MRRIGHVMDTTKVYPDEVLWEQLPIRDGIRYSYFGVIEFGNELGFTRNGLLPVIKMSINQWQIKKRL